MNKSYTKKTGFLNRPAHNVTILFFILLFLSIGAFQPFGCMTTNTGIVTDHNGYVVKGATVTVGNLPSVITGAEGVFTIEDMPYGGLTIDNII